MEKGIAFLTKGLNDFNLISSAEEVDFGISGLKEFTLSGETIYITTTHISMAIVSIVILIFAICANIKIKNAKEDEPPSTFQNIIECLVEAIDGLIKGNMGSKYGSKYVNYVGTLLLFIFLSNISGLFGLRPPTADYGTTLALALITFVLIQYNGFKYSGFGHITGLFKPLPFLFPINLIGEFATPLSMSLRLFGNILSGTVMMGLYYGLLPIFAKIAIPAALHVYFDMMSGVIQTFVFCMLTMVFISNNFPEDR